MDVRYVALGAGAVFAGSVAVAVYQGLGEILGALLIVVGIANCVKGILQEPDGDEESEPMPDPLPGRLCDNCGRMTSLDSSTCQYCGASLVK
jgi:hypothetical protein